MIEINLPQRFKVKLESEEKKYYAIILDILTNFENILNDSSLEFFPEYNNHGIIHLNNIFKIQDELITNESFVLLTVDDITTLIIATLSHDIGMHLNYEGFQTLINSDLEFSEKWNKKWIEFFQLSKKYNESKLNNLFGDSEPIIDLPKTKQNFRIKDYLLIGEFLRINHPELAEDILKYGFPIANNQVKKLSNLLDNEIHILNFSSLLAKSHGYNLRDTFSEIEEIGRKGDLISPHNIHIVYLMVILRLSDYLDIDKSRNRKIVLGLKNFMSNISMLEWDKNTAIEEVKTHWNDTEAIFIGVNPKNSLAFVNLKNLFKSIQYELDISWAVMGEIYSKDDNLKHLGISYRRLQTDIDDEISFSKKVNYIPKQIAFDSDSELLKLLIAPLYGDDPSYGVRELLQNAVDACKEYRELNSNSEYTPEINVNIFRKLGKCYFEIIDNGVGMTEDTIINYLLKAGASFRNSDIWRENFEDSEHHSKVERTGRFGVGLLASFLLGNKIEVKTKYCNSSIGYNFTTHLSDIQINIIKDTTINVGTNIKIEINNKIYERLMNDNSYEYDSVLNWKKWYMLKDINIYYNKNTFDDIVNDKSYINLEQEEYTSVKWYYESDDYQKTICNGFQIPDNDVPISSNIDIPNELNKWNKIKIPTLLIVDKDGRIPLSLSREKFLIKKYTFNDILVKSISNNIFNKLVNYTIQKDNIINNIYLKYPLNKNFKNLLFNKYGFNILNSYTIEKQKINKLVFIELNKDYNKENIIYLINELLKVNSNFILHEDSIYAPSHGYNNILDELANKELDLNKKFDIKSANIFIPNNKYSQVFTYKNTSVRVGLKDKLTTSNKDIKAKRSIIPVDEKSNLWTKNYFIKKEESIFELEKLNKYEDDIGLIVEMYIDYKNPKKENIEYYFDNLMEEYFKDKDNCWLAYSD